VKGSVRQHGSKWQYQFRGPERDPSTGNYPWITKSGFDTKKEAWQACREAMREADRGRFVKPSQRTVAEFLTEWFAAIEASIDATTWQNWMDYANAYVIPRIGRAQLQRLDEPQLLKLYATLLVEGRVKPNHNGEMYAYWADQIAKRKTPTAREVSEECGTTLHAARAALRRYKSGILPKPMTPGLAPKTVRNIHAMIHRALADAVAWKYISDNPASNVKPPKRPRTRRKVWKPEQIQTFLMSIQHDRYSALFLLELTTGIRRGQICGLKWSAVDLDNREITVHDNRVVVNGHALDKAGGKTKNADQTISIRPSHRLSVTQMAGYPEPRTRVLRQRLLPRRLRLHPSGRPPATSRHDPTTLRPTRSSRRPHPNHLPRPTAHLRDRRTQGRPQSESHQ
jgi:integrase